MDTIFLTDITPGPNIDGETKTNYYLEYTDAVCNKNLGYIQ